MSAVLSLVRDFGSDLSRVVAADERNTSDLAKVSSRTPAADLDSLPARVSTLEGQLRAVERLLGEHVHEHEQGAQVPTRTPSDPPVDTPSHDEDKVEAHLPDSVSDDAPWPDLDMLVSLHGLVTAKYNEELAYVVGHDAARVHVEVASTGARIRVKRDNLRFPASCSACGHELTRSAACYSCGSGLPAFSPD